MYRNRIYFWTHPGFIFGSLICFEAKTSWTENFEFSPDFLPRVEFPPGGDPGPVGDFFPQAMLGGFSFRAGEHTTSAVRKIAGPNQNDYNFRKNRIGNLPEKRPRKTCPGARVPLGPGPKGSPGARAQGFYLFIYLLL